MKDSIAVVKSFAFALSVIALYKELIKENEYVMSKQILRSATSVGANIQDALAGVSKKGFLIPDVNRIKRSARNEVLAATLG